MKNNGWIFLTAILLFASGSTSAATRTATTNGNWNNNATWGGNSFPVAGDIVNIPAGITVTIASARSEACASLALNSNTGSTASNLTFTDNTSTLNISGNFTTNASTGGATVNSLITMNGGTLTIGGTLTLAAARTGGVRYTFTLLFSGGGAVSVTGAITVNVSGPDRKSVV